MTLPQIVSRNQVQVADTSVTITARQTSNATPGIYICPAGKVAKVIQFCGNLDAVGADSTYAIAVNDGGTFRPLGAHVAVNGISCMVGSILLKAGDWLANVGDSGSTNGTIDLIATIREYDA